MDMPNDEDVLVPTPSLAEVVHNKLRDAGTPAFLAEFDPEEAALAGAFVEDALTLGEALDSATDLAAQA
jgi:hypothetical protein